MRRFAFILLAGLASMSPALAQRAPAAVSSAIGDVACADARGTWIGHFVGAGSRGVSDHRVSTNVTACFRTESQCRRFLYEMRSEFDLNEEVATCRPRG